MIITFANENDAIKLLVLTQMFRGKFSVFYHSMYSDMTPSLPIHISFIYLYRTDTSVIYIIIYKPKGTGRYNNRTYCDHSNVEVVEVVEKHGV